MGITPEDQMFLAGQEIYDRMVAGQVEDVEAELMAAHLALPEDDR